MFKKLIAAGATLAVALGIVAIVAIPAQAHTGDIFANAVCNTTTGQYDVTVTLKISNTNLNGTSYWKVGDTHFEGTPDKTTPRFANGPVASTHNPSTVTLGTVQLPGTTTGAPWVYAETTFTDGFFVGSDGQTNQLGGNCGVSVTPVVVTHGDGACTGPGTWSNGSYTIPDGQGKYTVQQNRDGQGYKNVNPGTYHDATNGETFQWKAVPVGTTSLTKTDLGVWTAKTPAGTDCDQPAGSPTISQTAAVCTADGVVGHNGTFTIGAVDKGVVVTYTVGGAAHTITGPNAGVTLSDLAIGSTVQVDVSGQQGYTVPASSKTYTITGPAGSQCVVPTPPTFTNANCTITDPGKIPHQGLVIPASDGITWTWSYTNEGGTVVTGSGDSLAPKGGDSPKAGTSVTVTATPKAGDQIPAGTTTQWTHAYPALDDSECVFAAVDAPATFTDAVCTTGTRGQITTGSYTLPVATGVDFFVTVNGTAVNGGASVAPGVYPVKLNDKVVVTEKAQDGFSLSTDYPVGGYSYTFSKDPGDCLDHVTPVTPTFTAQECTVDQTDGTGHLSGGTIDIKVVTGVTYEIDGKKVDTTGKKDGDIVSTTVTTGVAHTIDAIPATGYALDGYKTGDWAPITLTPATLCGDLVTHGLVDPSVTTTPAGCFSQGSFVLTSDLAPTIKDAVVWTVNGSTVAENSYPLAAGQTVTIDAAPATGYGFDTGVQTHWVFTGSTKAGACDLKTLALTGTSSPVGWIGLGYLLLVGGIALVGVPLIMRRRRSAE